MTEWDQLLAEFQERQDARLAAFLRKLQEQAEAYDEDDIEQRFIDLGAALEADS